MDGNKAQSWLIIIIIHQLLWANHSRLQQQVQPCPCIFNESSPTCVEGTWNTPSLPMFWCMFRYIILATDPSAYILPPGTSTTPSGESRHLYYCGEWCDSPGGEELGEKAWALYGRPDWYVLSICYWCGLVVQKQQHHRGVLCGRGRVVGDTVFN